MKFHINIALCGLALVGCGDSASESGRDLSPDASDRDASGSQIQDSGSKEDSGRPDTSGDSGLNAKPDADTPSGDGDGANLPQPEQIDCGRGIQPKNCPACEDPSSCDAASYTVNGDGTVSSSCCNLTWQRTVDSVERPWVEARLYCSQLSLAGGNWRLPSVPELVSLVKAGATYPSIDIQAFPDTPQAAFWTSTAAGQSAASNVSFLTGGHSGMEPKYPAYVRCVR